MQEQTPAETVRAFPSHQPSKIGCCQCLHRVSIFANPEIETVSPFHSSFCSLAGASCPIPAVSLSAPCSKLPAPCFLFSCILVFVFSPILVQLLALAALRFALTTLPFAPRPPAQMTSAKPSSVRRKYQMPNRQRPEVRTTEVRTPGHHSATSPRRSAQRKPSMTPTIGLRE